MHRKHSQTILQSPADDSQQGGGSPTPAASIADQLRAAISSKVSLMRDLETANATVASVTASLTETQTQLESVKADLQTKDAKIADLERQLESTKAAHADVLKAKDAEISALKAKETSVMDQLAQLGVDPNTLPKREPAAAASQPNTKEEKLENLQKRMDATQDPVEKGRLSKQWWAIYRDKQASDLN